MGQTEGLGYTVVEGLRYTKAGNSFCRAGIFMFQKLATIYSKETCELSVSASGGN